MELEQLPDCVVAAPPINDDSIGGYGEPDSVVTFLAMNEDGPVFGILKHPEDWHEIIFLGIPGLRRNPYVLEFPSGQEFSVVMIMLNVDDCPDPGVLQIAEIFSRGLRSTP